MYIIFCSPLPPPAKRVKLDDNSQRKCSVPHVLQGELARLCNRFQVKSGARAGVIESNTLLQCSISKEQSSSTLILLSRVVLSIINSWTIGTFMLFTGWEVRVVKIRDQGLETASRLEHWSLMSQFLIIQTDRKPVNNLFIFFLVLASHFYYCWPFSTQKLRARCCDHGRR